MRNEERFIQYTKIALFILVAAYVVSRVEQIIYLLKIQCL